MSINCVNCKNPVGDKAEMFAQVLLCPSCLLVATRLYERGERDLKALLVILKEAIREAIVTGQLQFSALEQIEEIPKRDLLDHLAKLASDVHLRNAKNNTCPTPSRSLSESTKSSAPSASGEDPPRSS